ncbi:hypothetical protein CYMTET_25652 [Cymbomonas tetramitiformis]|uniref:Pyruvate carboxyltransferase domain-containing protein n=1 Tax=Cymbomonas tetramitiformis TaxID=36881 RepID=A0AAE0KZ14_9CHLO|nr:hypothetical protein CYMTET_25652 [Cymbomonas tetramitiformis]
MATIVKRGGLFQRCNQTLSRLFSSDPTKFYDSQSGRWMNVPGAAGIRVHERSPVSWSRETVPLAQRLRALEKIVAAKPYSVELWGEAIEDLTATAWSTADGVRLAVRTDKPDNLRALCAAGVSEVAVEVTCEANIRERLQVARQLVTTASSLGMDVRAYILNAFDGEAEDENLQFAYAQEALISFADSGANVIVLSDTLNKAHEESIRELVEEAFYIDVPGETMLERLGLSASLEHCETAVRLGVQHFDASLRTKGDYGVPNTVELVKMLAAQGKECRIDRKALSALSNIKLG